MRCPPLRPMFEFDSARPCILHDELNDAMVLWGGDAEHWREHATMDRIGVFEWDGHLIDGWVLPWSVGEPWTFARDSELLDYDEQRYPVERIAAALGRWPEEIRRRIEALKPKAP